MKTVLRQNPVQTGRIFFILGLLASLACVQTSHAQEAFEVHAAVEGALNTKPGTIVAVGIQVANTSDVEASYDPRVILPDGWRMVTRDFRFALAPGANDLRLISFSAPPDAPAKEYVVRYILQDSAGHEAFAPIRIAVVPVIELELSVTDAPRFVVAGATFVTNFVLFNKGNSSTTITLRSRSSHDFPIGIDSTVLHFGPQETRQFSVRVATDARSGKVSHTLQLEAISGQDSTVRVRASSVVEVVPRETESGQDYFEYPVTVKLREVGQDGLFATQAEVYGYGSLSERRTDRLEFLLRGPETQTKSVLGQRDEYRVSYKAKNFDLYAGDLNYSLSTLTEFGRYATGGGGRAKLGPITAGGFYNTNRWSDQPQKETAGFLSYDVTKDASIGLNYLAKKDRSNSDVATLQGLFTPITGSTLELEYGTGSKDNKNDDAYSLRLNGNRKSISYDLRYVQAGPNFGGYYRDINFYSASVNVQATQTLRIETYVRGEKRNLDRDTNQVYAPSDKYYQVGAAYSDFIALYLRRNIQSDQLDVPKYRRQQDALQAHLGYSFSAVSLYLNAEYGSNRDELLNQGSPYHRLALYSSFKPAGNQNYSTSLEFTKERNLFTNEDQERLSASLNGWLLLGQSTQVQMNLYTSRVNTTPVQSYTLLEGSVEHIFPFNHKITLRGRESIIATSVTNSAVAYSLEYSIPLAVPVRRITAVGQLRGIVKGENGRGVPDVLINAGSDAALTNGKGEFLFSSLKPGSYYVTVDRASIGLENIMTQPTPIGITIVGGEDTPLDLEVTRSVEVTGSVILYSMKEAALGDTSTTYLEQGGQPGVFLELTNGTEINRRVTDSRGRFSFTDIRPGTWTLSVIGGNVPEYHLIIPDTIRLALSPGDKKDVTVQLKPRKRTIRILQEGSILPGAPAVPEKKPELPAVPEKKLESPPSTQQSESPCIVSYDAKRKGFVLQISSWLTKSKANAVTTQAREISGMKSFTVTAIVPGLGRRYRVYLGVFKSQKDAEEMCLKLRSSNLFGDTTSVQKKHAKNIEHVHTAKVSDTRQDEKLKYAAVEHPKRSWLSSLLFLGILVLLPR